MLLQTLTTDRNLYVVYARTNLLHIFTSMEQKKANRLSYFAQTILFLLSSSSLECLKNAAIVNLIKTFYVKTGD